MDSSVNYSASGTGSIKAVAGFLLLTVAPAAGAAAMMAAYPTAMGVGWAAELLGTGVLGSGRHPLRARPRPTERSG
jgi:hypothetical protein